MILYTFILYDIIKVSKYLNAHVISTSCKYMAKLTLKEDIDEKRAKTKQNTKTFLHKDTKSHNFHKTTIQQRQKNLYINYYFVRGSKLI